MRELLSERSLLATEVRTLVTYATAAYMNDLAIGSVSKDTLKSDCKPLTKSENGVADVGLRAPAHVELLLNPRRATV